MSNPVEQPAATVEAPVLRQAIWSTSVLSLLDNLVRVASAFIVSPVLIHGLGTESYGLWVLVLAWVGWFEMLDLGLASTAARFFSAAVGKNDRARAASLFVTLRSHYRRVSIAILVLSIAGASVVHAFFGGTGNAQATTLFLTLGVLQGLIFRMRVYPALLKGHLRYRVLILASSVRVILFSGAAVLLDAWHLTLETLLAVHVTLQGLEQLTLYRAARPLVPKQAATPLDAAEQREVWQFAGKNVTGILARLFRERIDTQILAAFVSLAAVGQYAVGVRLPNLLMDASNSLFGSHLISGFTIAAARTRAQDVLENVMAVMRLSASVSLTAGTTLFILGPSFIQRWLGPGFEPAGAIMQILLPGVALTAMQYPCFSILPAMNRHGTLAAIFLGTAVLNLIVSIILVQRIGLTGVVWGTTVELSVQALLVLPWLIGRTFRVHWFHYLSRAILRPLLYFAILVVPTAWFWRHHYSPATYGGLAIAASVIGLAGAAVSWWLILQDHERSFITRQLQRLGKPRTGRPEAQNSG